MQRQNQSSGYSLYELLVTLTIAATILGLGLPSLGSLMADKRLRVESNALFHAVHRARQESIVRRRVVTICPSRDSLYCDAEGDWSKGWIIFANIGRTGLNIRTDAESLIRHHQVGEMARIQANRATFSFRSTHLRATNGTLIVCDRSGRSESRAVVISYTGRPRVARKDRRGKAYECVD